MKNPAVFEVLSALQARGVAFWRIAVQSGASVRELRAMSSHPDVWRSRNEQLELLWQLGWQWTQERPLVSTTEGQAIGQRLLIAVEALRRWEN